MTIWTNTGFNEATKTLLRQSTADHKLAFADELSPNEADAALREADIAFGQPNAQSVIESRCLRWIHISSAGYTAYDRDDVRAALRERGAVMTNSSSVFDEPCAQHILAMMLAHARQLLPAFGSQRSDRAWTSGERRANSFLLHDQSVLLLGYGAIARRLVELLAPFEMNISAMRRHPSGDESASIVLESDVEAVLREADHVVNILPDNPSTRGWMNAARFAQMKRGARFYNIGRGATVDQSALLDALQSGKLGLAYLDVTDPEPLPPDHPLWSAPNCFLTPHTAGGHQGEDERLVEHFGRNLRAFERGEPLADCIWS